MLVAVANPSSSTLWWTRGLRTGESGGDTPDWAEFADAVTAAFPPAERFPPSPGTRRAAEAHLAPVVAGFAALGFERAGVRADAVVPAAAIGRARADLVAALARLAARAVVTTIAAAPDDVSFAEAVAGCASSDGLRSLLATYPVLARLLATTAVRRSDALAELLGRLRADVDALGAGGPVESIDLGAGDTHRGGRSVAVVCFADGTRVVYKPRAADTDLAVAEVLGRMSGAVDGIDLRVPAVVVRDGYSWCEHVAARPCADRAAVDRFYRRLGALTAFAHVTGTTDLHCENVVAQGEHPVLVDLETVLHPDVGARADDPDPARRLLDASVLRTALLPVHRTGPDLSGIGGDPAPSGSGGEVADWADAGTRAMRLVRRATAFTGAANRPELDGRVVEPAEHADAFVAGLRRGYDALIALGDDLHELLDRLAATPTRTILRQSAVYARLLDETTHPDVLTDADTRDAALRALARRGARRADAVVDAEVAQLWDGDIPIFTTDARSHTVRGPDGAAVLHVDRPALDVARARVAELSPARCGVQLRIAAAALATRVPARPTGGGRARPGSVAADPALVGAVHIADRLIALSPGDARRSNWVGVHRGDGSVGVLPLGADLADGYPGVALFLAELATVTGSARHAEHARRVVVDLPALLTGIAARPDGARLLGPGSAEGVGGIAYAVHRLGLLLRAPALVDATRVAVALTEGACDTDTDTGAGAGVGVDSGRAGGLLALLAVAVDDGPSAALARAAAARVADRLAAVDSDDAGLAWALGRAGRVLARPELTVDAWRVLAAADAAHRPPATGSGVSGELADLVRAHAELEPHADVTQRLRELVIDRATTDDTLGTGAAATVELGSGVRSSVHRQRRDATLARLAAIAADAPRDLACAEAVPLAGLRRGVAGIGLTLLRNQAARAVHLVPSVLDPTAVPIGSTPPHREESP